MSIFLEKKKLFRSEKGLTLFTNSLLQLLDVIMEMVDLAVAKPQINVMKVRETVTRIPTVKLT